MQSSDRQHAMREFMATHEMLAKVKFWFGQGEPIFAKNLIIEREDNHMAVVWKPKDDSPRTIKARQALRAYKTLEGGVLE